ncbi:hypothetical protein BDV25DRAFT_170685 [Aspergillus avenaceus]|uniref:DUF7730 domain-containing protein n=1 Tax=Aspergillus avenaceus TaxID=36643 RepID=A0A5N6TFR9_ASPAV|nr:hypothetical protein BDV25DRAFT_170685 [Aspergillus avenaceus]
MPLMYRCKSLKARSKASGLLRLPAELRWQIYQYLFVPCRVEIVRTKNKSDDARKPAHWRLKHQRMRPREPNSQKPLASRNRRDKWPSPMINLVFSCRTIYCETVLLLYSTTQFVFNSTNTVKRFLKTTTADAQSVVHHVELNHTMYNEPHLMEFREYKIRSDIAWYDACDQMAASFSTLKVLHIKLAINDWPIRLELGELWSMPLLQFAHYDGGLDYTGVQLQMKMFKDEKLRAVSRALEKKIMNPKKFQIREDEEMAWELMKSVKATKALRVIF